MGLSIITAVMETIGREREINHVSYSVLLTEKNGNKYTDICRDVDDSAQVNVR